MVSDSVLAVQVLAKRLTATANIIFCIVVMIYVANNRQLIFTIYPKFLLKHYFTFDLATILILNYSEIPNSSPSV